MSDAPKPGAPKGASLRPPASPEAAEFAQSLLAKMQQDFVVAPKVAAAEKANAAATAQALLGQMHQDFVHKDREKKEAAAHLAQALLNKVTRDFGTIPPPPATAPVASVTTETDADLRAAGEMRASTLSAEDLVELDAMVAPTGFWGKLVGRMRGRKKG